MLIHMLIRVLVSWLLIAVALALTAEILDSVTVDGGTAGVLWVAALFGLVNAIIGPFLRLLSLPITLITFGLFSLVVNAALFALTAGLTEYLNVGGFLSAVAGAFLVSVLASVMHWVLILVLPDDGT